MEQVTADLVEDARKGRGDAIVEILTMHYAPVWRIATGLTGRADVGRGIVKFVMQRSLRATSKWHDDGAPTRWFHHHTLLTARRTLKHKPDTTTDTLLNGESTDTGYIAFIRALRGLPMQQREAFILTHGEKLDIRAVAVAMDCSVTAATNHLRESTERLKALAANQYDGYAARLHTAYQTLGPDEAISLKDVRQRVRTWRMRWLVERTVRLIVSIVLLVVLLWGGWWIWRIIEHSMRSS